MVAKADLLEAKAAVATAAATAEDAIPVVQALHTRIVAAAITVAEAAIAEAAATAVAIVVAEATAAVAAVAVTAEVVAVEDTAEAADANKRHTTCLYYYPYYTFKV